MRNPYKALLDLLPSRPLQVGDVSAVDGATATVDIVGGGTVQARGTTAVGQRVFVRDGVIEGEAPSLPLVVMEV